MNYLRFWNYIDKEGRDWLDQTKRIGVGFLVFFILPILVYLFVTSDFASGFDKYGEPESLGMWTLLGLYWYGLYLLHKKEVKLKKREKQLKKLFSEDLSDWRISQIRKELDDDGVI